MKKFIQKYLYPGAALRMSLLVLVSLQLIGYAGFGQAPFVGSSDSVRISRLMNDSIRAKAKIDSLTNAVNKNIANRLSNREVLSGWAVFICLVCLFAWLFVFSVSRNSPRNQLYALGLPDGSIRAIIAILAIIFYILASVSLPILITDSTISVDVTKTLGTLVVAISSFYFGSKTAEQSSKNTTENLSTFLNKQQGNSGGQAEPDNR